MYKFVDGPIAESQDMKSSKLLLYWHDCQSIYNTPISRSTHIIVKRVNKIIYMLLSAA